MKTIGLIAGNGRFPFLVADEIRRQGDRVVVVALNEETDPSLEKHADTIVWLPLGQLQKLIDTFKSAGVTTAIMAGQVKHRQLFAGLKLDLRAIGLLGRLINKKTDTILGAVVREFEKEGIHFLPSHHYLAHLVPKPGILAGPKLSSQEKDDIEFGYRIAKEIAGLDIGQTIAVKDTSVLAVESIEGTDECIRRAAQYAGNGTIVIKVAKPKQDWRFDLPVIGPATIETMKKCGARAIAVDAQWTLLIEKETLLAQAEAGGITIVARDPKN